MATGPQLKELMVPRLGISPSTFDRYLAELASAKLIRRSGPGGRSSAVHLASFEIANLLLAFAAPRPAEAATTARALGGLFPEPPRVGDASLATLLAASLEIMAHRLERGGSDFGDPDWQLTLCVNPLQATMAWPSRGPEATRRFLPYIDAKTVAPAGGPAPEFRRDFVISQSGLIAVARLMTLANTKSAASLPGETAPIARPEASGTRNTAKATPRAHAFSTPGVTPCPTMTTTDFLI